MAVVKEYTLPSGVHIKIMDDYYRDKTDEEKRKIREEIDTTFYNLCEKIVERKNREAETKKE